MYCITHIVLMKGKIAENATINLFSKNRDINAFFGPVKFKKRISRNDQCHAYYLQTGFKK